MKQPLMLPEELRERRQALGLSIDDVYRKLRIPVDCVRAFEEGRAEDLPTLCYAQGFLRTYCQFLELDPEPYVDILKETMRPTRRFLNLPAMHRAASRSKWLRDITAWAAVCAILALGWLSYSLLLRPEPERAQGTVQAGTVDFRVPESPPSPE